jgi:protein-S-isoprenylcysteine O-methyltransferase Ste14
VNHREWILANFGLFRLALFLCCFVYWLIGYYWFKPRGREFAAAVMAVWTQFSVGVGLDILVTRRGYWTYRPMELTLYGVPLDLHINWGLVWGFFLVWLYSRLRKFWRGTGFVLAYLAVWTVLTVLFDAAVASQMLFMASASPLWWLADGVFLFVVQGITLWVYHTILFPPQSDFWAAWFARIRATLAVGSIAYLCYGYVPAVILSLTNGWGTKPLLGMGDWRVLLAVLALPVALGTWATWEFTEKGFGTPIPLDPPRHLVMTGLYAYVRNPQQISGILLAVVLALYYPTPYMAIYVVDMILVSLVLFAYFERGELEDRFGDAYREYRSQVRNWLPRSHPYSPLNSDTARE